MKKFLLIAICTFLVSKIEAKNSPKPLKLNKVLMIQNCYTSWSDGGNYYELYVVYDGSACDRSSQAASLWINGELVEDGDCTDTAVYTACGFTCGYA